MDSNYNNDDVPLLPSENARRASANRYRFIYIAVVVIVLQCLFTGALEVYELSLVTNATSCLQRHISVDIVETVNIWIPFLAILAQLIVINYNSNWLFATKFDRYPMLIVMIILAIIDVLYYVFHFINIGIYFVSLSQVFVSVAELSFGIVLLPFVIECVCYKFRTGHSVMKVITWATMLAAANGCVVIFLRRVFTKIRKDVEGNCSVTNQNEHIGNQADSAEHALVLVDVVYYLMGFVFLVDLLFAFKVHEKATDDESTVAHNQFLKNISMIKYRWPVLVFSIMMVAIYLAGSLIIDRISNSSLPASYIVKCRITFFLYTTMIYIVGIICSIIYYKTDHSPWQLIQDKYVSIDSYFNKISSTIQIIYGCQTIAYYICIMINRSVTNAYIVHVVVLTFLIMQVATQAWYINSVVQRTAASYNGSPWKSYAFPPAVLALINFAFLSHSILFVQNSHTGPNISTGYQRWFTILHYLLAPIAMLNRLHAMCFFVNLSILQWMN